MAVDQFMAWLRTSVVVFRASDVGGLWGSHSWLQAAFQAAFWVGRASENAG
jgi:hypothetical protein